MKKLTLIIVVLLSACSMAIAQSPIWLTADTASSNGGITVNDYKRDVVGNHYFIGQFSGTASFGGHKLKSTGNNDGFVLKLNSSKKVEWLKHIGGHTLRCVALAIDSAENVFVTGHFRWDIIIDVDTTDTGGGSNDGFMVKYNKNGKTQWTQFIHGPTTQEPSNIALDKDGAIYWAGSYKYGAEFKDTTISNIGNETDGYLAKLTTNGKMLWLQTFNGAGTDEVNALGYNGNDELLIAGAFRRKITIDTTTLTEPYNYRDIFVASFDTLGNFNWAISGGGKATDYPTAIASDNNGGFALAGFFDDIAIIGGKRMYAKASNFFIARFDNKQNAVYAKPFGGTFASLNSKITNITIDKNQGVLFGGYFEHSFTFKSTNYKPSKRDIFVGRITDKGGDDWLNTAGGKENDLTAGISFDSTGVYHIGGTFATQCDFNSIKIEGTGNSTIFFASGFKPVEAPKFKTNKILYTYADSVLSKSFDLGIKTETKYKVLKGPNGLKIDSTTALLSWLPDTSFYGRHSVNILAENIAGSDTAVFDVWVIAPPKVTINSPAKICFGQNAFMKANVPNSGPFTSYWELSDNHIYVNNSILHTFKDTGVNLVKLKVENAIGHLDSTTHSIRVLQNPTANFSFKNACVNDTLILTDNSTNGAGTISEWRWQEDGKQVSSVNNYKTLFVSNKSLNYKLTVISNFGCSDSIVKKISLKNKPKAKFSAPKICADSDFLFSDQSTTDSDSIIQYEWDFGDGDSFRTEQPVFHHKYTRAGSYFPTLFITTSNQCTSSFSDSVFVLENPIAHFVINDQCGNKTVKLNDNSKPINGTIKTTNWRFGDGDSSTSRTVSHRYNKFGEFEISLIVTNTQGCFDTLNQTIKLLPELKPQILNPSICTNSNTTLKAHAVLDASDSIVNYSWSINNIIQKNKSAIQFQFSNPNQNYRVRLKLKTKSGCVDSTVKDIKPSAFVDSRFELSESCIGDTVQIKGDFLNPLLDSVFWIGHHVKTFKINNTWQAILEPGNFHQLFLRTYANSCEDSSFKTITAFSKPNSAFTFENKGNNKVVFTATNMNAQQYQWNFGDGDTGSLNSVVHRYALNGIHKVSLNVTSKNGCSSITTQKIETSTGIQDYPKVNLELYPNPTTSSVTLSLPISSTENATWILTDLAGKTLKQGSCNNQVVLNLENLPRGLYNISVLCNSNAITKKLILE